MGSIARRKRAFFPLFTVLFLFFLPDDLRSAEGHPAPTRGGVEWGRAIGGKQAGWRTAVPVLGLGLAVRHSAAFLLFSGAVCGAEAGRGRVLEVLAGPERNSLRRSCPPRAFFGLARGGLLRGGVG